MIQLSSEFTHERLSQLIVDQTRAGDRIEERIAQNAEIGLQLLKDPTNKALQDILTSICEDYKLWHDFNLQFLSRAFTDRTFADRYLRAARFHAAGHSPFAPLKDIGQSIRRQSLELRSIASQLPLVSLNDRRPLATAAPSTEGAHPTEVFLIHGHDNAQKEEVASTIAAICGARPTILHEQPDGGKTIIEKLEHYAGRACFAVAILTADDQGGAHKRPPKGASKKQILWLTKQGRLKVDLIPRARQNVILELGYFWAMLTRKNVVILYEPGVELPSDAHGVLYKPLDPAGIWKLELAKEMEAAGLKIDRSTLT